MSRTIVRKARRTLSGPVGSRLRFVLSGIAAAAACWWAAAALVEGGAPRTMVLGLAAVSVAGPLVWLLSRSHVRPRFPSIEAPVILLLLSTLVWRIRDAETLASDPLDTAGLYRVLCVGLAGLLGVLAMTERVPQVGRITTRPFRLYALYVFVVFAGAPLSLDPMLTAYRGVELATALIVVAGAYRIGGLGAMNRIERTIYLWSVGMMVVVWVGALLVPSEALVHLERSPLPWQIHGVLPSVSANGVGTLAVVVAVWSFAFLLGGDRETMPFSRGLLVFLVVASIVTLVFAQYRTGYVAVTVGLVAVLLLRSRPAAVWVMLALVVGVMMAGPSFANNAEPVLLRGQSAQEASQLSSRLYWWRAALPVWQESPLIGRGLLTGTRFEVLAPLGRTTTSSIHGTWVEALVGTGLIGTILLASSFLVVLGRSIREAILRRGGMIPGALLLVFLVRSVTGSTFEVFGAPTLLLLAFALSLRDPPRVGSSVPRSLAGVRDATTRPS